jgi:hypothetical protein
MKGAIMPPLILAATVSRHHNPVLLNAAARPHPPRHKALTPYPFVEFPTFGKVLFNELSLPSSQQWEIVRRWLPPKLFLHQMKRTSVGVLVQAIE